MLQELKEFFSEPKGQDPNKLEYGEMDFVLVLLRSDEVGRFRKNQADLLETALLHKGMIFQVLSSLTLIAFKYPNNELVNSNEIKTIFVSEIRKKFEDQIKILHGRTNVHVGNVGSDHRMAFTPIFSDFSEVLYKMNSIRYGQVHEISL